MLPVKWFAEMGDIARQLFFDAKDEVPQLQGHSSLVTSVSWGPNSSRLASASYDKTVRLWHARTGQEVFQL